MGQLLLRLIDSSVLRSFPDELRITLEGGARKPAIPHYKWLGAPLSSLWYTDILGSIHLSFHTAANFAVGR